MVEVSFGEWLKRQRGGRGLTQEQLAQQIGCATITLRKIESEERRPSVQIIERLAGIFDFPQNEQEAFLRFARGDWRSAPGEIEDDSPWQVSARTPRSNLPAPVTSLIGRKKEIADVCEYLRKENIRLVTLIGPPGIGKTRLSIESARAALVDFQDGVFFVTLAPLDNPALIRPTILQALGYVEAKHQSARQQLVNGIGDKHLLLVLDNCEHLIEDIALLVSDLLSACLRLKILATSRESLRVPGEWLYSVPSLDIPKEGAFLDIETASVFPALALFVERARAVRSDFALDSKNIQSVITICMQLDGLPLAIELLAARIRLLPPQDLLERLSDQFMMYADGMRAIPMRQKTLQHTIGWSYNLLSAEEKNLFMLLSVFSGGFTLEAAEAIFSQAITEKPISGLITSLLDKSLLQHTFDPLAKGDLRFNMLVTIQRYALERLRHAEMETEARDWHLDYFLHLAEQAENEIHGPDQVEWLDRLKREQDNLRTAMDWCLSKKYTESALRLLNALGWASILQNHYSEMNSWFNRIRALPDAITHSSLFAKLLNHMGRQKWLLGEYQTARSILKESQMVWLKLGTEGEQGLAEALVFLGMIARSSEGDNNTAHSLYEQSLELYQKHGDRRGMAFAMFNLGWIAGERGENAQALSLLEQSLDLFRQLGDVWGMGRASQILGQYYLHRGNHEKARLYFDQHLMIDEGLNFTEGTVIALLNLGELYRHQRDYDQAEQFYQKGLDLSLERGLTGHWTYALYGLGMLALHKNNYQMARKYFIDEFSSAPEDSEKINACDFLAASAAIAAGMNQPQRAAKLHGAARALFETTDYQIPPFDRAEFDRHIKSAREQIGDVGFEALAAEGRAMTIEQAIAFALGKSDG